MLSLKYRMIAGRARARVSSSSSFFLFNGGWPPAYWCITAPSVPSSSSLFFFFVFFLWRLASSLLVHSLLFQSVDQRFYRNNFFYINIYIFFK